MQLVRPGPIWGKYPINSQQSHEPGWSARLQLEYWFERQARARAAAVADNIARQLATTDAIRLQLNTPALSNRIAKLRSHLRRDGLQPAATQAALKLVAQIVIQTHGLVAYPSQLKSAWLLIHQTLVELPTGEGKSLTAALAACVMALADMPVHLMTANDYLAKRDAEHFEPLYAALGLNVAAASDSQPQAQQQMAFGADITYCTTRTAAFAYLRDIQLPQNHPDRILKGLCCALIDEADVALLDEARTPLILAQQINDPSARVRAFQAVAQAKQMVANQDFSIDHGKAVLTSTGKEALNALDASKTAPFFNSRHHHEQVEFALKALHCLQVGRDYLVQDKQIELLDIHSGRVAAGRQLSHGLHDMLAVKEGLPIPKQTQQIASTSYARFFAGYYRLSGLSGTLTDSQSELEKTYRRPVIRVAPHRPSQRKQLHTVVFTDTPELICALVKQVGQWNQSKQPVLVATQDVTETTAVANALRLAGLTCQTLTAQDETIESQIIAQAGQLGAITVATQLAGRGTDIHLSPDSEKTGGLIVLSLQMNRNHRTDRQVFGRCARQGQPGCVVQWYCASSLSTWVGSVPKEAQLIVNRVLANPTPSRVRLASWLMQQAWERDDRFARQRSNRSEQNWAQRLLFSTVRG
jgi:preprotein translocase subunit SecA